MLILATRILKNICYASSCILFVCVTIVILYIHVADFMTEHEIYLIADNCEVFMICFSIILCGLIFLVLGSICSSIEHWDD